jgi:hypothetical protein
LTKILIPAAGPPLILATTNSLLEYSLANPAEKAAPQPKIAFFDRRLDSGQPMRIDYGLLFVGWFGSFADLLFSISTTGPKK